MQLQAFSSFGNTGGHVDILYSTAYYLPFSVAQTCAPSFRHLIIAAIVSFHEFPGTTYLVKTFLRCKHFQLPYNMSVQMAISFS